MALKLISLPNELLILFFLFYHDKINMKYFRLNRSKSVSSLHKAEACSIPIHLFSLYTHIYIKYQVADVDL